MTDSFFMRLCTERYDRKPFEHIKPQILTCCVKQKCHRDFFGVRRIAAPKRCTKYKRPRQTINHVDNTRYTYSRIPPPDPEDLDSKPVEIYAVMCWWSIQPLDWRRWDSLISLYVLVGVLDKRQVLSLYGCNLFIYVMILPCSLQKPLTRNQTLFNVWIHVQTYHSSNLTKVSYLV